MLKITYTQPDPMASHRPESGLSFFFHSCQTGLRTAVLGTDIDGGISARRRVVLSVCSTAGCKRIRTGSQLAVSPIASACIR